MQLMYISKGALGLLMSSYKKYYKSLRKKECRWEPHT